MLRRLGLALLAFAVLVSAQAAPATAEGEPDTGAFNAFNLKGSNGYRLIVLAGSYRGYRNGEVLILVGRKGRGVSYLAPATVTDTKVEADLGEVGRISLEFEPSGDKGVTHPVCDSSERITYEKGFYVGTFEFRGEEGFTEAVATKIPFSLHPWVDFGCGVSGSGEVFGRDLPGARLAAWSNLPQGRVVLQAIQNRPGARGHFEASISEERGPLKIERQVELTSPAQAFEFAPDLRFAALRPDGPFSGTGTFRRGARISNRWTGNLDVDFPGRSNVSLTGDRFRARLVHARFFHPDRIARPNLSAWPSTKPSPTASVTSSPLALR